MKIFIILIIIAIIAIIAARNKDSGIFEAPQKRAGRIGERQATNLIRAFLLYGNSPVKSEYMISELDDIRKIIHTAGRKYLTQKQ